MSKKSPPQKKRHTKPCRYFQINRCPHPADVCDFAHVVVSPVSPVVVSRASSTCEYFSAGRCTNDTLCLYRHDHEFMRGKPYESSVSLDESAEWPGALSFGGYATYPESPSISPPLYGNFMPYIHSWPPSAYASRLTHPIESAIFSSPARSRESIDTSTSVSSSAESDEVIVITDGSQYDEHSHSYQSQVQVVDPPTVYDPPVYPTLQAGVPGSQTPTHYDKPFATNLANSKLIMRSQSSSRSSTRRKSLKYKTKPCKFFTPARGCPNGDACTFVHDETFAVSPSPPMNQGKDESEEISKRNFFPIPWRVIGGGVLVGVKKDDACSDDNDNDDRSPPPIKVISRKRSNSIPPTSSPISVKVEHLFSAECPGVL